MENSYRVVWMTQCQCVLDFYDLDFYVERKCWVKRTEIVDVLSLEVFKARLDGALSNQVQWKVSLPIEGGLELDNL